MLWIWRGFGVWFGCALDTCNVVGVNLMWRGFAFVGDFR